MTESSESESADSFLAWGPGLGGGVESVEMEKDRGGYPWAVVRGGGAETIQRPNETHPNGACPPSPRGRPHASTPLSLSASLYLGHRRAKKYGRHRLRVGRPGRGRRGAVIFSSRDADVTAAAIDAGAEGVGCAHGRSGVGRRGEERGEEG